MGQEGSIQSEITEERIAAMMQAGAAPGATADAPTPEANDAEAEVEAVDAAEGEGEAAGQPQKSADPKKQLAELQQKLKDYEERERNTREMQSQAHRRNSEAAEMRRAAEMAQQRAEAALSRQESIANAMSQIAATQDPEIARQLFASLHREQAAVPGTSTTPSNGAHDPLVTQLKQQIEEMQKNVQGFAFNVNYGAVSSAVERQIGQHPILQKLEKAGRLDESIERVMQAIVAKDQESPGSINPHSPKALNEAVKAAVADEAKRVQKLRDLFVNDYREERKNRDAKAPASTKGPSASVRTAPSTSAKLPANMSMRDKIETWTKEMTQLRKRPVNGMASEI